MVTGSREHGSAMSSDSHADKNDVPIREIAVEALREKSIRRGHISTLHLWWARRPLVTARAAVYGALAPAEKRESAFLKHLCTLEPAPKALDSARQYILEEHVRRLSQDRGKQIKPAQVKSGRLPSPRVLDMFAGGGSIPIEAMRLGSESYALDLNPLAYLIEMCTLHYPQLYGQPSRPARGSGEGHTWSGLAAEVRHWAKWVQQRVRAELAHLYPAVKTSASVTNGNELIPLAYLWTRTIACPNPTCNSVIPLTGQLTLRQRRGKCVALIPVLDEQAGYVKYEVREASSAKEVESAIHVGMRRGKVTCPYCDTAVDIRQADGLELNQALIGLICLNPATGSRVYLSTDMLAVKIETHEESIRKRLKQLTIESGISVPDEPLPARQLFRVRNYGLSRYADLFTARQLLLLLTFVKYIQAAHVAMLELRMDVDRAKSVVSYLGLLVSNLVRFHNALSTWNGRIGRSEGLFSRPGIGLTDHFAEANPWLGPFDLLSFADRAAEVIQECSDVGTPAHVYCASAGELPFEDEYFDAIVTDPPHYDAIPYADLSDFFYVWLKRSVGHLYSRFFVEKLSPKKEEIVVAAHRHDDGADTAQAAYLEMMTTALKEAHRTLKPGRMLTVMFYSRRSDVLQIYLDIAQKAGFELFEASRFASESAPDAVEEGIEDDGGGDFILYFRKSAMVGQPPYATTDAAAVLNLARQGRSNLYTGLAGLILDIIREEDIEPLIPFQYSGTVRDRLAEYIASREDPEQFLTETLGIVQLRLIAKQQGMLDESLQPGAIAAVILGQLGFNIPSPPQEGVESALDQLNRLASQVLTGNTIAEVQGYLIKGMGLVESVLQLAAWAWAQVVFGTEADKHLCKVIGVDSLDRLSMGHIKQIFCDMPDYIAKSSYVDKAMQLFGQRHIYKPKKCVRSLDQLVAIRNRVVHNKDNYLDTTPLEEMKREFNQYLLLAVKTLRDLKEHKAIPLLTQPTREIQDLYGRRTIVLQMEDKTEREIFTSGTVILGENYVYLWDKGSPKPLDPVMLPLSEISK
jgi:putative DNA methylase